MIVTAIVVAAGSGKRLGSKVHKPLVKVAGLPLVIHCLKALDAYDGIKDIVLVVNAANRAALLSAVKHYRISKVSSVVLGGARRQDSVWRGLKAVTSDADFVLIHDAGRPFINRKILSAVIKEAARTGAAIAAVPVKDTIKEVVRGQTFVKKTLDRDRLWEVQTPQVFKREIILEAYNKFDGKTVTDDAALVERLGKKVSLVMAAYSNIKVTTPEDLIIAEAIANRILVL
ncbi:MAG: 2-C-methyl-D-erythritol 4-phosphate cytidylyltransferase [Candidatus Omnitrophota bacterium]|nr:2-C-methyl-D-erythritol 4-phosphate cytidylyltransferase [Candidatus Omnitrophota bacterium]